MKTGVLIVNLGTPDSPKPVDVKTYLHEFLTDGRVIDVPWLWRQLLVRGTIVPKRYKQSAACYARIWTEAGSPLMVYGERVQTLLQQALGPQFHVELAMRYRHPSIPQTLSKLLTEPLERLIVLPLFPQYASATTGSIHQCVMEALQAYPVIPHVQLINNFATHPAFIAAFAARAAPYSLEQYDHILFSYHGLPERQLRKADKGQWCLKTSHCCQMSCRENKSCYAAQCYATTRGLVDGLKISREDYSVCFQSRLGKEPWLQPYTSDMIHALAKQGKKQILVFCPSFVCDCLETIYEIGEEYNAEFKRAGGERLHFVPGLNDDPLWIEALVEIIKDPLRKMN